MIRNNCQPRARKIRFAESRVCSTNSLNHMVTRQLWMDEGGCGYSRNGQSGVPDRSAPQIANNAHDIKHMLEQYPILAHADTCLSESSAISADGVQVLMNEDSEKTPLLLHCLTSRSASRSIPLLWFPSSRQRIFLHFGSAVAGCPPPGREVPDKCEILQKVAEAQRDSGNAALELLPEGERTADRRVLEGPEARG
jgi:hypothetical protein